MQPRAIERAHRGQFSGPSLAAGRRAPRPSDRTPSEGLPTIMQTAKAARRDLFRMFSP